MGKVLCLHLTAADVLRDGIKAVRRAHILDVFGTVVDKELPRGDQRLEHLAVKVDFFEFFKQSRLPEELR